MPVLGGKKKNQGKILYREVNQGVDFFPQFHLVNLMYSGSGRFYKKKCIYIYNVATGKIKAIHLFFCLQLAISGTAL